MPIGRREKPRHTNDLLSLVTFLKGDAVCVFMEQTHYVTETSRQQKQTNSLKFFPVPNSNLHLSTSSSSWKYRKKLVEKISKIS